jgi:hypothetical protein
MSEALSCDLRDDDCDIAAYEVSEDGVTWRPFDPTLDEHRTLHRRTPGEE